MRMRTAGSYASFAREIPWTCSSCLRQRRPVTPRLANYVTRARKPRQSRGKRSAAVLAAAGGALGAGVLAFSDDVKHIYAAAERSGRVVSTLAVCINE